MQGQSSTSQWRTRLGITSGNPFAPFIILTTVITIIAAVILLGIVFFGSTPNTRFTAGIVFMFVTGLAPIAIGLLVLGARNHARFQGLGQDKYWVHWQYPANSGYSEVFINGEGVYYPDTPRKRETFLSGVQQVEIQQGYPSTLHLRYIHRRYYSLGLPPVVMDKQITVPIPAGKEAEAQVLVERFNKQLGKPSAYVDDQWRIGWIMSAGIIIGALISIVILIPLQFQVDDEKRDDRNATATAQYAENAAELSTFLPAIRKVMDRQIERLKTLQDGTLTPVEVGFDENSGVRSIYFGHCPPDNAFYMYVVMNKEMLGRTYLSGPGGFNYTEATDRRYMDCGPDHLISTVPVQLKDGWYYGVIAYIQSTRTPRRVETVMPTLTIEPASP